MSHISIKAKFRNAQFDSFYCSRAEGCLNLLRRVWMAGGKLGSTREGKDPWKDFEVIGTQQRPGSGFKEAWLGVGRFVWGFKTPPCVVSIVGKQKG